MSMWLQYMDKWTGKRTGLKRAARIFCVVFTLCWVESLTAAASSPPPISRNRFLKLLEDRNAHLRAYAVYNVAYRFPQDVPNLARFISDAEPLVRRAAIFSLGLLHFEAATERFLEALQDPHYGVRRAAVFALGNLNSPKGTEGVAQSLKDRDSVVRQLAVLGMARVGVKSSVPRLIPLLRDESPRVRRAAACALGMLGDRSALGPLKRLYRDRERSKPPSPMLLANEKAREALTKKLNLGDKFLYFTETLDKLSKDAGVAIRVDDEVLFMLNTSAGEPENLNSVRLAMWKVPFEKALAKVVETVGAYYYVESGTINISTTRYRAYDTPVALEVAGAMALLGDRSAIAEVQKFLGDTRTRQRAQQLLHAVTGR